MAERNACQTYGSCVNSRPKKTAYDHHDASALCYHDSAPNQPKIIEAFGKQMNCGNILKMVVIGVVLFFVVRMFACPEKETVHLAGLSYADVASSPIPPEIERLLRQL